MSQLRIRTFLMSLAFLGMLSCFAASSFAAPRTMSGACGAVLPKNSRLIAARRYHVTYHRALSGILKMYRKVYGKNNPRYRMFRLFSLSNVVAYHLKSNNPRTRWKGLNIVRYAKRKRSLQIYVLCRK